MCRGRLYWAAALLLLVAGCDIVDPPPMDPALNFSLSVTGGADQIGLPGTILTEPISVRLHDDIRNTPVRNREIFFRVPAGSGMEIQPVRTVTDSAGTVRAQVRLGRSFGRHEVKIDFAGNPKDPVEITIEAAHLLVIPAVTPGTVSGEGVITIRGQNFGLQPNWNDVRIGNLRATVIKANTAELKVQLPRCLASGTAHVVVRRGSLQSAPAALTVSCLRLAARSQAARYLVMPLNVAQEGASATTFQVFGSSGNPSWPTA